MKYDLRPESYDLRSWQRSTLTRSTFTRTEPYYGPMCWPQIHCMSYINMDDKNEFLIGVDTPDAPNERAYRLWERGRERSKTNDERALRDLKLAATLFERKWMRPQLCAVLEDIDALRDTGKVVKR